MERKTRGCWWWIIEERNICPRRSETAPANEVAEAAAQSSGLRIKTGRRSFPHFIKAQRTVLEACRSCATSMAVRKDFKEETGLMCAAMRRAAHCVIFLTVCRAGLLLGEEKEAAARLWAVLFDSTFQSVQSPRVTWTHSYSVPVKVVTAKSNLRIWVALKWFSGLGGRALAVQSNLDSAGFCFFPWRGKTPGLQQGRFLHRVSWRHSGMWTFSQCCAFQWQCKEKSERMAQRHAGSNNCAWRVNTHGTQIS